LAVFSAYPFILAICFERHAQIGLLAAPFGPAHPGVRGVRTGLLLDTHQT
jgi:hypothetical protein